VQLYLENYPDYRDHGQQDVPLGMIAIVARLIGNMTLAIKIKI